MQLNPPRKITWYIALVVMLLGLLGYLVTIPVLSAAAFWLELAAALLLLLATWLKGL
jgi:hypothetical protein